MINILMATYNGEEYIKQQIESLFNQTIQDFILNVCDDHSTDSTYEILLKYAKQYPDKIHVSQNSQNSGSAKGNFFELMLRNQDDYIMLCDQDDVWLPNKIEISLSAIQKREMVAGKQTPILLHTDLCVVDKDLHMVNPSLNHMLDLHVEFGTLASQIVQNTITGCTTMYNRALAELIKKPPFCIMHDWWIGLVATAFGEKIYLPEATILYRQHDRNVIGAKHVHSLGYIINRVLHIRDIRALLDTTYQQASAFLQEYEMLLNDIQIEFLQEYVSIPTLPKFKRWHKIGKLRTVKHGFLRRVAQLLYI